MDKLSARFAPIRVEINICCALSLEFKIFLQLSEVAQCAGVISSLVDFFLRSMASAQRISRWPNYALAWKLTPQKKSYWPHLPASMERPLLSFSPKSFRKEELLSAESRAEFHTAEILNSPTRSLSGALSMGDVPLGTDFQMISGEQLWLLMLLPVGFVAGVINVLAGGGSFLTLPVLIASGLPVHIANGTNRISVIVQGLFATAVYKRSGEFDPKLYKRLLLPLVSGAILGAILATKIEPEKLKGVFGVLFLTMAFVLLLRDQLKRVQTKELHPLRYPGIFVIGMYGGFIQAGVGLWILLASTSLFGVSAVRANTVKLPLTLTFTVPALLLFLHADMVAWIPGLILALGTVLGTVVGVRLSLKGGEKLIFRCVTAVLLISGIHLLL
jgi:uncharacterized membrane protein YfcA